MTPEKLMQYNKIIKDVEIIALMEKFKYSIKSSKDLDFYIKIIDIFLRNYANYEYEEKSDYVDTAKSIKYAYQFLKKINPEYGQEFIRAYNEGTIKLDSSYVNKVGNYQLDDSSNCRDMSDKDKPIAVFTYDFKMEKPVVKMPVENTISDAVVLVHEFIHYLTINDNNIDNIGIYMETPTIASEYLFEEMYSHINGVYSVGSRNLEVIYENALYCKIKLMLFKHILNNAGRLDLEAFIKSCKPGLQPLVIKTLDIILYRKSIHVKKEINYMLGTLLSFDAINDENTLNEIMIILQVYPKLVGDYLELEVAPDGVNLKEEILARLEENFVKKTNERNEKILKRNENNNKK